MVGSDSLRILSIPVHPTPTGGFHTVLREANDVHVGRLSPASVAGQSPQGHLRLMHYHSSEESDSTLMMQVLQH